MRAKTKKSLIITSIVIAAIIVVLGAFLVGMYIHENNYVKDLTEQVGNVPEYNWSAQDSFNLEKYPVITPASGDGNARVLQLTDLHWRNSGTFGSKVGMNYIMDGFLKDQVRQTVENTSPDLIVITGDLITYAAADHAYKEIVKFFDSLNVKWTVTFGNHDAEYNSDKGALGAILKKSKNCLFDYGPTNLVGLGNSLIRVNDKDGNLTQAIITMDSNDYVRKNNDKLKDRKWSTENAGYYTEQIEWYQWVVDGLKQINGGTPLTTSIYAHIPLDGETDRFGFSDTLVANGSTRFIFTGHTHATGNVVVREDGLISVTANKAGINYQESPETGGALILMNKNNTATIAQITLKPFSSFKYTSINNY